MGRGGGDEFSKVTSLPKFSKCLSSNGVSTQHVLHLNLALSSGVPLHPAPPLFIYLNNHNPRFASPDQKALLRSANTPPPHPLHAARSLLAYENDPRKTR